jgi:hypothetical protein
MQMNAKLLFCAALLLMLGGCGKPKVTLDPNWVDVNSKAQFGSQCPDGSWIDPMPATLQAIDCNTPVDKLVLAQPMPPLMLNADCTKKVITVRAAHPGGLDATWEALPDSTFDFDMAWDPLTFADDGRGHPNCIMPTAVNIFGKLNCQDRDHITIDFQADWRAGQLDTTSWTITPYDKLHPASGQVFCQVAPTCYLTAGTKLKQCP